MGSSMDTPITPITTNDNPQLSNKQCADCKVISRRGNNVIVKSGNYIYELCGVPYGYTPWGIHMFSVTDKTLVPKFSASCDHGYSITHWVIANDMIQHKWMPFYKWWIRKYRARDIPHMILVLLRRLIFRWYNRELR